MNDNNNFVVFEPFKKEERKYSFEDACKLLNDLVTKTCRHLSIEAKSEYFDYVDEWLFDCLHETGYAYYKTIDDIFEGFLSEYIK